MHISILINFLIEYNIQCKKVNWCQLKAVPEITSFWRGNVKMVGLMNEDMIVGLND